MDTGLGLNIPPPLNVPHLPGSTYTLSVSGRNNMLGNPSGTANVNILRNGSAVRLVGLEMNAPVQAGIPKDASLEPAAALESVASKFTASTSTNLDTAEGDLDIGFSPDTNRLTVKTSTDSAVVPTITLAANNPTGADYTVSLSQAAMQTGSFVALSFDSATGHITVENNDPADNNYVVAIDRVNANGTRNTAGTVVSDGTGVGVIVDAGPSWSGDSSPTVTTNTTVTLPTAPNLIYLPMISRE